MLIFFYFTIKLNTDPKLNLKLRNPKNGQTAIDTALQRAERTDCAMFEKIMIAKCTRKFGSKPSACTAACILGDWNALIKYLMIAPRLTKDDLLILQ